MRPEESFDRIMRELRKRFADAGWGSVGKTARALGVGVDYFSDQRRRRSADLLVLLKTLNELHIDPCEFFNSALGSPSLELLDVIGTELDDCLEEEPENLRRIRDRLEREEVEGG